MKECPTKILCLSGEVRKSLMEGVPILGQFTSGKPKLDTYLGCSLRGTRKQGKQNRAGEAAMQKCDFNCSTEVVSPAARILKGPFAMSG